jgi:hypothetical protein
MEKVYNLSPGEENEVKLSCRFIADRQERPCCINLNGKRIFESYKFPARIDMYWVDISFEGEDLGAVSIEPDRYDAEDFMVDRNWCKIYQGYDEVVKRINKWFKTTPEYKKQVQWIKNLIIKNWYINTENQKFTEYDYNQK